MPQEPEHVCTLISKRIGNLDLYDKDGQIEELCDLVNELKQRCEEWHLYLLFVKSYYENALIALKTQVPIEGQSHIPQFDFDFNEFLTTETNAEIND